MALEVCCHGRRQSVASRGIKTVDVSVPVLIEHGDEFVRAYGVDTEEDADIVPVSLGYERIAEMDRRTGTSGSVRDIQGVVKIDPRDRSEERIFCADVTVWKLYDVGDAVRVVEPVGGFRPPGGADRDHLPHIVICRNP